MNRRTLLLRIVQGFSAVGAGFLVYPFVRGWIPDSKEQVSLNVDLSDLQPGEWKLIHWLGRKIIVRRRSRDMVNYLENERTGLKDPASRESEQPPFATNEFRSRTSEYFVAYNNCTHLGCEVTPVNDHGVGFECPCHKSDYDYAGRVMAGGLAPLNLEVPWYRFVSDTVLELQQEVS